MVAIIKGFFEIYIPLSGDLTLQNYFACKNFLRVHNSWLPSREVEGYPAEVQ